LQVARTDVWFQPVQECLDDCAPRSDLDEEDEETKRNALHLGSVP